uniref:RING-type E3 ubiquitin transferase n=1 Tax=Denticeps clupeoides TaxID=299321 RepID=A0AAY4BHN7_9TELE
MPVQAAQWTEFLSCPICYNEFDGSGHKPISLGCSHTVCKTCLHKLHRKACPFDQTAIATDIDLLPVNCALLQLLGAQVPEVQAVSVGSDVDTEHYEVCRVCVEELAVYLKPISGGKGAVTLGPSALSRPMQRKLVTLVNCQLVEEEGRVRAVRAGRSLGERTVTELILQHQNPQQLSANLWAAVRARGCQFLGPAMQEDSLKLVLLALEDGSALSRKVLVLFVVQKLEARFPQASKTSIGHVVQLLYRASCFKVTKRDEDSSLMQLKEEFRTYEALRREHDAQIVHIAMEAGLRISPEQWSSLLYGDLIHKSHMQSIIDKLQSPESFAKSVQELTIVLQRTGDPANLNSLRLHLELLANIDHNPDAAPPSWEELESVMLAVKVVVHGLVEFIQNFSKKGHETPQPQPNSKYKTSMCRDLRQQGGCPRGANCTFAHTQDELEKYRMRNKKISGAARPFLTQVVIGKGSCGKVSAVECSPGGLKVSEKDISAPESPTSPQLISRGANAQDELKRTIPNGANDNYYPSAVPVPKPCVARFIRSSNVPESSLPPAMGPAYPDQPSSLPPRDRLGPSPYSQATPYSSLNHGHRHGVYAPVYDSRRAWRPQMYHREDGRSNSLPPEVLHSSVYQPPLRERYNSLDSPYCSMEQRAALHRVNAFTCHLPHPQHSDCVGGACMSCKYKVEESLAHYSPWSCGTIGPFDSETHGGPACSEHNVEGGPAKRWLRMFEPYGRLKDEDPIIPFGEGPIISKWGAISRASRTGYHTTDPVQATASQGSTSTTPINFRDYSPHVGHGDYRWGPRVSDSSSHSSFLERCGGKITLLRNE